MKHQEFEINYFQDEDGMFTAEVPAIRGCVAWGKTIEECYRNAVDGIESCIEARARVALGTISYLGSHGAELLRAGWTQPVLDENVAPWARRVQEFGRDVDMADLRRLRVRIEDKGLIVAFHWMYSDCRSRAAAMLRSRSAMPPGSPRLPGSPVLPGW